MINDHTLARFAPLSEGLLRPIYDDYSFANIPNTIHHLLTGETIGPLLPVDCFGTSYPEPEKVVLMFIDSFGWEFWQRWLDGPRAPRLMHHVVDQGRLTPISALFPSTTSASVSTMNFGVMPSVHGLYEWNMYVPEFGETVQSLPFARLGQAPGSCTAAGFDIGGMVLARETAHHRLVRRGVRSIQLANRAYASSAYNRLASAGAEIVHHSTLAEGVSHLAQALESTPGKAFIYYYWASLDTLAHIYGPGSREHDAEVTAFWAALDALTEAMKSPDTLFLFTADHGHVGTRAADTVYVNERWPQLHAWLSLSPTGQRIIPGGCPRDLFLHILPEARAEALDILRRGLGDTATVMTMDDAVAAGLFGTAAMPARFRERLGDILILPSRGHFISWREPGRLDNKLNGHHGGLSPEEVVTVLGVVDSLS